MNINVINKPHPHCEIPYGHPLYSGYIPAEDTNIRQTWKKVAPEHYGDDYDLVISQDWLSAPGGFR